MEENSKAKCELRRKKVKNKNELKDHKKLIHNSASEKHFKCQKCNKVCPSFESLVRHHLTTEDKFFSKYRDEQTDVIKYCGICHKEFKFDTQLHEHKRTHKDTEDNNFMCINCEEKSPQFERIATHSLIHNTPEVKERISILFQSELPKKDVKENGYERSSVPTEITKSPLEKQINEVARKIDMHLEMHEITPAVGNCWYEACSSLMKLNKMRNISAKELRKEVVDNIDNCENFGNVFEMIFGSDYKKLAEFKEKHSQMRMG